MASAAQRDTHDAAIRYEGPIVVLGRHENMPVAHDRVTTWTISSCGRASWAQASCSSSADGRMATGGPLRRRPMTSWTDFVGTPWHFGPAGFAVAPKYLSPSRPCSISCGSSEKWRHEARTSDLVCFGDPTPSDNSEHDSCHAGSLGLHRTPRWRYADGAPRYAQSACRRGSSPSRPRARRAWALKAHTSADPDGRAD